MIRLISDHIVSPLGRTTRENLEAVLRGDARLFLHAHVHGATLAQPLVGSLMESLPKVEGCTAFESMCITAAQGAIREGGVDASADDCIFVVSTTKGDIWKSPAESAQVVARYFGNPNAPIVVSTACTSGVSAQLAAYRLLRMGTYRTAVVIGCDVQCEFIVSGFQSFKALSDAPCRPFDQKRNGLNAGEAAAAMVLQRDSQESSAGWQLLGGAIHNDANHISGPSRTAEGSLRCLQDMLPLVGDDLALVSVHGTGTPYNDEMESIALHRAGLDDTPVTALKGNYGHTMGAAGLMETILSLHALDEGLILPTKGYEEQGTSYAVNLSTEVRMTDKRSFIKLLSGFGGVNAAVAWTCRPAAKEQAMEPAAYSVESEVRIGSETDLVAAFREQVGGYPKFFKMDTLSRLGFLATELLLKKQTVDPERTALILANHSSSLKNDTDYQQTIADKENYYPSPALFVYTLPNIVTGEVAIRHHLFGETAFYVLESEAQLQPIVDATMADAAIDSAIVGWVECPAKDQYQAHLSLIRKQK